MPKGQRVILGKTQAGAKKTRDRIDGIIKQVNDHDERINELEKSQEFETVQVVKNGLPYTAEIRMKLKPASS